MAYPIPGSCAPTGVVGLGGLGGAVTDAIRQMTFAQAKDWIGGPGGVGVPYNGTATTAAEIANVWETLVPISNGDVSAMMANLHHPDPYIAGIAKSSLKRALEMANPEAFVAQYHVTPELYQELTGRAIVDEPWWRFRRENEILATVFPYLGGRAGVIQGDDHRIHEHFGGPVLGPDQSIYDPAYNFAALEAAAKAWAAAHPGGAPTPEAIAVATGQATPPAPSGPPAGWRAGELQGKTGYWGPDGLFYPGDHPWTSYVAGTGMSINAVSATPQTPTSTAPAPASAAPTLPAAPTEVISPASPTPAMTPYVAPSAAGPAPSEVAPAGPLLTEGAPSAPQAPAGSQLAGVGWLVALGLAGAALVMGRRK